MRRMRIEKVCLIRCVQKNLVMPGTLALYRVLRDAKSCRSRH